MYSLWQDLSVHTKNFDLVTLTLTFDLLLKKLNLDHNFWTKSDWALILHISIPCDKTSLMIPIFFWPCDLDLDFDLLMEKLELVAAGGISPVRTDPDLVNSIFQNRLLLNSPPLSPNECTAHFSSRLSCNVPQSRFVFDHPYSVWLLHFAVNILLHVAIKTANLRSALLHCRWRDVTCRWFHIWKRLNQGALSYQSDRICLNV